MNTRQQNIFNYLLNQKDYVTAKVVAKQFNVTPKTVYLDINILRDELEKYGLDIDKKTNKGILLIGSNEAKQQALAVLSRNGNTDSLDVEGRRKALFRELIIYGKSISLQKTSDEYYVSKSAVLNDLDFLRKSFLTKFNVQIKTSSKKLLYVSGSEENIQSAIIDACLSRLMRRTKDNLSYYFEEDIYTVTLELINNPIYLDTRGMADYYKQALLVTFLVYFTRIKYGFHVKKDDYFFLEDFDFMKNYPIANDISSYIYTKLNLVFTDEDKTILAKYLAFYRINPILSEKGQYYDLANSIINRLEEVENIVIVNREELTNQLVLHIPAMIMRLRNGIKIENPLLDEIKSRYLHLFTLSWYVLSVIETKYGVALTEDEISFVTIYFQMAVNKSSNSHRVLVVCPYGIVSSKYVVAQLRNVLPRYDDIQACGYSDLKNQKLDNLDLIVSTSSQKIETLIPVVHVSPMLDNVDCAKIFDAYAKNVFMKRPRLTEAFNKESISVPTIKKYINEDLLFFKENFETKEECLDFMIFQLEKRRIVKSGFKESVYRREEIGITVLENGVAIPHGMPSEVNQVALVIMTMEKPVKWSGHWVDTVFLIAVPEDKVDELETMIVELYSIISNKDVISEIKKIRHKEEYLNAL